MSRQTKRVLLGITAALVAIGLGLWGTGVFNTKPSAPSGSDIVSQLTQANYRLISEGSYSNADQQRTIRYQQWARPDQKFPVVRITDAVSKGVMAIDNVEIAPPAGTGQSWNAYWFQPTAADAQNLSAAIKAAETLRDDIANGRLTPEPVSQEAGGGYQVKASYGTGHLN